MGENKGQTIFLSVIGIATLLVAIIGATFAYFTTSMGGAAANVSVQTASIGSSTFTAEGVTATGVLPGWTSGAKTVTVSLGTSDLDVDYTCKLNVTANTISDLKLVVAGDNAATIADPSVKTGETVIASGTLTSGDTKSMTYTLTFPETGTVQDTQQGATVTATVSCSTAAGTVYYNATNPGGTTVKPEAQ